MKIGISRPSSTPDEAHEVFAAAVRWGFAGVQMKPHQYQAYIADSGAFRKRYGEVAKLATGGMIVYLAADIHQWPEQMAHLIPFAAQVGAELLCLVASVERHDAAPERFRDVAEILTQLGCRAQASNIRISLHNHANCLFESTEDLARLFGQLDPGHCGFTLDTAHAAKGGIQDVPALVSQFSAHLDNVHLKDMDGAGEFCPLGLGQLELVPVLDALKANHYVGWLIVDEESNGYSTDEAYRLSKQYLAQHGLL